VEKLAVSVMREVRNYVQNVRDDISEVDQGAMFVVGKRLIKERRGFFTTGLLTPLSETQVFHLNFEITATFANGAGRNK
jgi:hypothetical protein